MTNAARDNDKEVFYQRIAPFRKTLSTRLVTQLERYVFYGEPPSRFVLFALCNKLVETVEAAEPADLQYLPELAKAIKAVVFVEAWGSESLVRAWIQVHRRKKWD